MTAAAGIFIDRQRRGALTLSARFQNQTRLSPAFAASALPSFEWLVLKVGVVGFLREAVLCCGGELKGDNL
jgi:hypothetical protein